RSCKGECAFNYGFQGACAARTAAHEPQGCTSGVPLKAVVEGALPVPELATALPQANELPPPSLRRPFRKQANSPPPSLRRPFRKPTSSRPRACDGRFRPASRPSASRRRATAPRRPRFAASNGDRRLDRRMRVVADDLEVFVP